jgi:hypothetical protein
MVETNEQWINWSTNMQEAPVNQRIIVQDDKMYDTWATFDPDWGKGRGAWFNDKNQIIKVYRWHKDSTAYVAQRSTGPHIVPIK